MIKCVLAASVVLLSFAAAAVAQQDCPAACQASSLTLQPTGFANRQTTLTGAPLCSFANAFNTIATDTPASLPTVRAIQLPRTNSPAPRNSDSSAAKLVDWRPRPDQVSGEIGVTYGRGSGKYGGEFKQGYILGEVNDDKVHISVGAAYEESSARIPRFGR